MTGPLQELWLDASQIPKEEMEAFGEYLINQQQSLNWWIGDLARAARVRFGEDNYSQVFPPTVSPGLIQRCEAVAKAYPKESRNPLATWSIHMREASRPDRIKRVQDHVDAGRTSDEAAKASRGKRSEDERHWLLAVDVNYFLHRFWYSGAGVEAAVGVATWIQRTVERLREKGLTDVACCFDSKVNHRKELTKDWEKRYKDRPPKDPELGQQLNLVYELLKGHGFACVLIEGMEADDVMASYAKQFDGRVTLLSQDKDLKQCLSDKCNMLLDVEWTEDETSGQQLPDYKWLSAKQHTEATGIPPNQWVEYQAIMGDATDGIAGANGIGQKGAADLVKQFGTVEAVIEAAKNGDESIREKKRQALIEFESRLEVTRQLVTLHTDLELPSATRITA
jgi:5'-3' exonuclease